MKRVYCESSSVKGIDVLNVSGKSRGILRSCVCVDRMWCNFESDGCGGNMVYKKHMRV